jgi:hypothetical protein
VEKYPLNIAIHIAALWVKPTPCLVALYTPLKHKITPFLVAKDLLADDSVFLQMPITGVECYDNSLAVVFYQEFVSEIIFNWLVISFFS